MWPVDDDEGSQADLILDVDEKVQPNEGDKGGMPAVLGCRRDTRATKSAASHSGRLSIPDDGKLAAVCSMVQRGLDVEREDFTGWAARDDCVNQHAGLHPGRLRT